MNIYISFTYRKLCIIALSTGAIGTLAFSPYNIWPAAIISLIGLLILNYYNYKVVWLGFIWGFGFFGTGISWIYVSIKQFSGLPILANILIIILLISYLAIYPMCFIFIITYLWPNMGLQRLIFGAPVIWTITESLRSYIFTGFPWLEFGYSQIDGPLKGLAPLFGVKGITFFLVIISGLIVFALTHRKITPVWIALIFLLAPWPLRQLKWYIIDQKHSINVSLIQGNIHQSLIWKTSQIKHILDIYLQYTLPSIGKAQIVIWPESAIPDNEILEHAFLKQLDILLKSAHTSLITGIIYAYPNLKNLIHYKYYNSAIVLGDQTPYKYNKFQIYNKYHLVPFGEKFLFYNVLNKYITAFNLPILSFHSGRYKQPQLHVAGMNFTTAICYEIIFGNQIRDNFRSDTNFLLNISNDIWFGNSIGPWQHLQMARMRALELGRPLLRIANNGITAIIDANGIIQTQLPQFTRNVLNAHVFTTYGTTPYANHGSLVIWFIILLFSLNTFLFSKCIMKNNYF